MEVTAARRSFLCDIGFWADRTALHEAASHGRALQLKELVDGGASVNVVTVDNITPLHDACTQAHTHCARLLLEAGAQVDVRTIHGSTPLCNACSAGSLECAKLLLQYGAKVNPSLTALTASPLQEACIRGNVDIVLLMITSGARLEAYDIHFGPPLHAACAKGHVDCATELLRAADVSEGAESCAYWPRKEQPISFEGFSVSYTGEELVCLSNEEKLLVQDFILESPQNDDSLEVRRYGAPCWPNPDSPISNSVHLVNAVREYSRQTDGPTVVLDLRLEEEGVVDVYQVARMTNLMRPGVFNDIK
ncbi:ankyrin repeat and SOCS box protein 5-like [Diretmus argenteus]